MNDKPAIGRKDNCELFDTPTQKQIKELQSRIQSLEADLVKAVAGLKEIAEWPRNPHGPNYSQKYIAQQTLKNIVSNSQDNPITKAVEAERERCLDIIEPWIGDCRDMTIHLVAEEIANEIRKAND